MLQLSSRDASGMIGLFLMLNVFSSIMVGIITATPVSISSRVDVECRIAFVVLIRFCGRVVSSNLRRVQYDCRRVHSESSSCRSSCRPRVFFTPCRVYSFSVSCNPGAPAHLETLDPPFIVTGDAEDDFSNRAEWEDGVRKSPPSPVFGAPAGAGAGAGAGDDPAPGPAPAAAPESGTGVGGGTLPVLEVDHAGNHFSAGLLLKDFPWEMFPRAVSGSKVYVVRPDEVVVKQRHLQSLASTVDIVVQGAGVTRVRGTAPALEIGLVAPLAGELKCPNCLKEFGTHTLCMQHFNKYHKNLVPCTYDDCLQAFTNKGKLANHIDSFHLGHKSFTCSGDGCGVQFTRKSGLVQHEKHCKKLHPDLVLEPVQCTNTKVDADGTVVQCPVKVALQRYLKDHLKKCSFLDKTIDCGVAGCEKKFVSVAARDAHRRAVHRVRKT